MKGRECKGTDMEGKGRKGKVKEGKGRPERKRLTLISMLLSVHGEKPLKDRLKLCFLTKLSSLALMFLPLPGQSKIRY